MLQRGVFEDLVRNTIVNASLPQLSKGEVSLCGEPFQLLVLVKSQSKMLWNTGGILQKDFLPTIEKLFSKGEQSDFSTR